MEIYAVVRPHGRGDRLGVAVEHLSEAHQVPPAAFARNSFTTPGNQVPALLLRVASGLTLLVLGKILQVAGAPGARAQNEIVQNRRDAQQVRAEPVPRVVKEVPRQTAQEEPDAPRKDAL